MPILVLTAELKALESISIHRPRSRGLVGWDTSPWGTWGRVLQQWMHPQYVRVGCERQPAAAKFRDYFSYSQQAVR